MRDVLNFKPKTTGTVTLENGELFDFDTWLAERGLSRTMINELFATHVTSEEEAPEVVTARERLEAQGPIITALQEIAADVQSKLRTALDEERNLEAQVILAKCLHLGRLKRRAMGLPDDNAPPAEKPKRQRKSRRS